MKHALRRIAFVVGFGGAVAVFLAAGTMDLALGKDVLLIAPHDPSVVKLNRELHMHGEPVPQLYGNPMSETIRVVLPARDRLIRPVEDPALLLLEVDKLRGENPLQTQTVWFFAKFFVPAFALLGLLGFAFPRRRSV
jgi:hypothetical protein